MRGPLHGDRPLRMRRLRRLLPLPVGRLLRLLRRRRLLPLPVGRLVRMLMLRRLLPLPVGRLVRMLRLRRLLPLACDRLVQPRRLHRRGTGGRLGRRRALRRVLPCLRYGGCGRDGEWADHNGLCNCEALPLGKIRFFGTPSVCRWPRRIAKRCTRRIRIVGLRSHCYLACVGFGGFECVGFGSGARVGFGLLECVEFVGCFGVCACGGFDCYACLFNCNCSFLHPMYVSGGVHRPPL